MNKELRLQYICRDRFEREVFLAPEGTISKSRTEYLVDVAMDYHFHNGRNLHTLAFSKGEIRNPYYGEPDCPISPDWNVTVENDDWRRECNENPFRKTYMLLDRMRCDVHYHIGYARMSGAKPIQDTSAFIEKMKELWNSLPQDGKPEWLTWDELCSLEEKMDSDKVYLQNPETGKLEERHV